MNHSVQTGALLALATAALSGVSIYVNSVAVHAVPDPFLFTTAKNTMVALALAAAVLVTPASLASLKRLTAGQWGKLTVLGLVGGSMPFLLFFYGLSQATAPSAAFIHKTLFLWVACLAVPLLGERLGRLQIGALALLVLGNLAIPAQPLTWALGIAELCVLGATLLWACEAVLAKEVLAEVPVNVAALGRMGFGAIGLLVFVLLSGHAEAAIAVTAEGWVWVTVTAVLLLGYVQGYYRALQLAPATVVASLLVVGSVITSLLNALLAGRTYDPSAIAGLAVLLLSATLWMVSLRTAGAIAATREAGYAGR